MKVILKDCRAMYPTLFQPRAKDEGGAKRYTVRLILNAEAAAILEASVKQFYAEVSPKEGAKLFGKAKAEGAFGVPADVYYDQLPEAAAYAWTFSCARQESQGAPVVVGPNSERLTGGVKSGDVVNVQISIYRSRNKQAEGKLCFGLEALRLVSESDKAWTGGADLDDEFKPTNTAQTDDFGL